MPRILLFISVLFTAAYATAAPHWGTFEDHGCLDPDTRPGLREYSAQLWGIPWGASWEDACAATPAAFPSSQGVHVFAHPAVCVNAMTALGQSLCIDLNTGLLCHKAATQETIMAQAEVEWPFGDRDGPGNIQGPALGGWIPHDAAATWMTTLNDAVRAKGTDQHREGNGGAGMWGTFFVADETCLPPDYDHLPQPHASWHDAAQACRDRGLHLCTRDELCLDGDPLPGRPAGDVWAPVADAEDEWVSIGQAWPGRTCRTHTEVTGSTPFWSVEGPESYTGQPTTIRCCTCYIGCTDPRDLDPYD